MENNCEMVNLKFGYFVFHVRKYLSKNTVNSLKNNFFYIWKIQNFKDSK